MSFLQRLKTRGVRSGEKLLSSEEETALDTVAQLHVDVYQTEDQIVIYAQAGGTDMADVQVSIEGDADIILLEGRRLRPENLVFPKKKPHGSFVTEECVWGDFYRRIILPDSVNIEKASAKIKNGVLIVVLPLLKQSERETVKLKITNSNRKKRMS